MHAHIRTKYGADWPETNPENAPDRQPKLPLLGATHPELISVLFHMYFFFSTCTLLLINTFIFFTMLVSWLNFFFSEDKNQGPSSSFSPLKLV